MEHRQPCHRWGLRLHPGHELGQIELAHANKLEWKRGNAGEEGERREVGRRGERGEVEEGGGERRGWQKRGERIRGNRGERE